MTRYNVVHETKYETDSPVSVGHNQAWLRPRSTALQTVENHQLVIEPQPSTRTFRKDIFGNAVAHLSFDEGYRTLVVRSEFAVHVQSIDYDALDDEPWEHTAESIDSEPLRNLEDGQFRFDSRLVRTSEELAKYARQDFSAKRPFIESLRALTTRVFEEFEYDPAATTVSTPVEHVFRNRRGVCQDFAHLQIAMLRSLGIPARYVSGYVRTGNMSDRPEMVGADASHAWLSAWSSTCGWIDADPTNKTLTTSDHVTIAWGRDYSDVPPFRGVFIGGGNIRLDVGVSVTPVT